MTTNKAVRKKRKMTAEKRDQLERNGITSHRYYSRLSAGWDEVEACTKPVKKTYFTECAKNDKGMALPTIKEREQRSVYFRPFKGDLAKLQDLSIESNRSLSDVVAIAIEYFVGTVDIDYIKRYEGQEEINDVIQSIKDRQIA